MIKVVNKKKEEPKIYRQVCEECGTELEFEYSDTYEGALSLRFIKCPECGQELAVEDVDDEKLTSKNIEFPKHFFEPKGTEVTNEKIQNWVRECLKFAETSDEPAGYFVVQMSGNTAVILLVWEDEYQIIVTKDYYETSIERVSRIK